MNKLGKLDKLSKLINFNRDPKTSKYYNKLNYETLYSEVDKIRKKFETINYVLLLNQIHIRQLNKCDLNDAHQIKQISHILSDSDFSSAIFTKYRKSYKYYFKCCYSNTSIYLIVDSPNISKYTKDIYYMFYRISVLRQVYNNQQTLTVYYCPFPMNKQTPTNGIFKTSDINSGMTIHYGRPTNGIIFIWRKQEFLKVLVHELIHSFSIDSKYRFPVYETYTEFMTVHLNIFLELMERNIYSHSNYKMFLELEQYHGLYNAILVSNYNPGSTNIVYYLVDRNYLLLKHNWKKFQLKKNMYNLPIYSKKNEIHTIFFTITEYLLNQTNYNKCLI